MRRNPFLRSVLVAMLSVTLVGAHLAGAQGAISPLAGITVIGHGEASAPAETALLHLIVGEAAYGAPPVPQPGVVPGEREREAVAPIVASLVEAGVAENQIEVIVGPSIVDFGTYAGPAMAVIRFRLDDPTSEQIDDLLTGASIAAADERLIIGRSSVLYGIEDCAGLRDEARELAVADARQQAEAMSGFLDVSLGGITASRVVAATPEATVGYSPYGPYGFATSMDRCEMAQQPLTIPEGLSLPPFDPSAEAEVSSYAAIELTFSIETDSDATPAG